MTQQTELRSTVPKQGVGARPGGRDVAQPVELEVREPAQPSEPTAKPKQLKPPAPVNMPRTPFIVLVVMVVVTGVMGILVLNSKINSNAFKIADLKASQDQLDLRQQQLEQYIAQQETPGSLAAAAAKLGLTDPGPPAFISLPDGKIIGVPRPASGPTSITSQ